MTVLAAGHVLVGLPVAKNNFGDTESGGVAGPLGLVVIVLLAIATVLLIRNMNRRLRRLPERFDPSRFGPGGTDSDTAREPQESDKGVPLADFSRQDRSHQDHADQGEAAGEENGDSPARAEDGKS
ncbi:MAG: hypothetical protein WCA46_22030 [Actinocatenispora sp.]